MRPLRIRPTVFVLACLLLSAARAGAGTGPMFSAYSYTLGAPDVPNFVILTDLNRDGMDDVVAGLWSPSGLAVAFATGGGAFTPFTSSFTANGGIRPLAGDFDGDGLADVGGSGITGPGSANGVFVAYGDGNGGWSASFAQAMTRGPNAWAAAAADLNGDGRTDLVFSLSDSDSVAVWLGNANRTLSFAGRYATAGPAGYAGIAIGDVTGSPAPDLIVGIDASSTIEVFPGIGDGTFGPPVDQTIGTTGSFLALAPIDGQPGLDLLRSLPGVSLASGLGGGVFDSPASLPEAPYGGGLVTADFNGDGKLDVASSDYAFYPRTLKVWLGDGLGGFGPRLDSGGSISLITGLATGDVDQDSRVDLAHGSVLTPAVTVEMGNGDGTFGSPTTPPAVTGNIVSVAAGDFDGDGKPDAVAALIASGSPVELAHGHGDGSFDPFTVVAPGAAANFVVAGRFDSDSNEDLLAIVAGSPSTLKFYAGQGNGTFAAPVAFPLGDDAKAPTIVDLDQDGDQDVVVPCRGSNALYVLRQGPSGLGAPVASATAGPVAVRYSDLNADGRQDRVVASVTGLSVELDDGVGGYTVLESHPEPLGVAALALADLDEDGAPDIAAVPNVPANGARPRLQVFKGHPGGTFDSEAAVDVDYRWQTIETQQKATLRSVDALDVDGDGHLDVVCRDGVTTAAIAARGRGDRTFDHPEAYSTPFQGHSLAFSDFDSDGHMDILVGGSNGPNSTPSTVGVLLNRAGHLVGVPPPPRSGGSVALAISRLSPNPSRGHFTIDLASSTAGRATIGLYSAAGRLVHEQRDVALVAGPNHVALDAGARLPAGMYWVRATLNGATATRKAVVLP